MEYTERTDTMNEANSPVSWRELLNSGYGSSLALVCLAVWLHAADSMIVATMLPAIVAEIGGIGLVGWSVSLYEIGSIVAGAASAFLSVRYGLRTPMAAAALLFGTGCLLSAVSPTMPMLLAGRLLQGLGGGGLVAMAFVGVGILFPRRYTARTMAAISTLWGLSAFLGPLVGGLFVELATWRWGFAFFGLQALVLSFWIFTRADAQTREDPSKGATFPVRRLLLLALSVVLIALGGVSLSPWGTTIYVGGGLACLLAFLRLDTKAGNNRLLPIEPLNIMRPAGAALVMIGSLSIATIAITAFGPLLITKIHGASALTAGYIIACSSIGWSVAAVAVSGSAEQRDRFWIASGIVVLVLSIIGFLFTVPHGPLWLIAICAILEGAGFGLAWTFILRRTIASIDKTEVERVSGAMPTVQRLGYALGAAYIGIVANASGFLTMSTPDDAANVATWMFMACLPFAAIGLVATAAFLRSPFANHRREAA